MTGARYRRRTSANWPRTARSLQRAYHRLCAELPYGPRATNLSCVRITASPGAVALARSWGGRLYVWPTRSAGCQPITMLHTSVAPVAGRTFHRAEFDPIELNLALASRWPQELELVERRGKVWALWDGSRWAI